MQPEPAMLRIQGLRVRRGSRRVIHDLSLEIDRGEPFAILGESGSGKTTLLYAAAGLIPIEAGVVKIMGERLEDLGRKERARKLGLVFQDYQLFPHLTAWENLLLAPRLQEREGAEELARGLLEELRIDGMEKRYPHELSGGQQQRVAIARSLILEPSLLFFDEPSAALDAQTSEDLADLLRQINERTQIVVVSHDLGFVERCCSRGIRLAAGKIAAQGSVEEISPVLDQSPVSS